MGPSFSLRPMTVRDNAMATAQAQIAAPTHAAAPQTILVVDDRPINRDFLVSLLRHFGYKLREAESAEQAWDMAVAGGLDLIITDAHMNGMDGFTLIEKLAAHPDTSHIPAIVYTAAYKNPDFARFVKAHQKYAVLTKPSAPEAIVEAVHAALGAAGSGTLPSTGSYRNATLIEIMQDLGEEVEPDRLLQMFCKSAAGLLNAKAGFVYSLGRGEGKPARMFSTASNGPLALESMDALKIASTMTQIISGHATGRFRRIKPRDWGLPFGEQEVSCLLAVPVFTAVYNFGCLCLVGKIGDDDFAEDDERLAVTLASLLARLYEHAVSFGEIQDLASRLAYEVEERKRADEELERTRKEQIRLRDEFFSHVSHELRSPVMAVQQFLEILEDGTAGAVNSQQREYIQIALRNINQLNTMISDLLEVTRIQVGKLRISVATMSLSEVLEEAISSARPAAAQRRIDLSLDLPSTLPLVIADRSRVRQIATNLLDNAIKFTSEHGSVAVKVHVDEKMPAFVRVVVSDTGCGLSPEEMSKVFERHYQAPSRDFAARKGLGLGLCICKELVTLQGGQIEVQSRPGRGSDFSFTLPIFSARNLLNPILSKNASIRNVVVLTVELITSNVEGDDDLLLAARQTLETCILPDLDVLLPGSYATQRGRMFVVIAATDPHGAQVMTTRIEGQLKHNLRLDDGQDRLVLRSVNVDLPAHEADSLEPDRLGAAVARIDTEVAGIIAQRN